MCSSWLGTYDGSIIPRHLTKHMCHAPGILRSQAAAANPTPRPMTPTPRPTTHGVSAERFSYMPLMNPSPMETREGVQADMGSAPLLILCNASFSTTCFADPAPLSLDVPSLSVSLSIPPCLSSVSIPCSHLPFLLCFHSIVSMFVFESCARHRDSSCRG